MVRQVAIMIQLPGTVAKTSGSSVYRGSRQQLYSAGRKKPVQRRRMQANGVYTRKPTMCVVAGGLVVCRKMAASADVAASVNRVLCRFPDAGGSRT